MAYKQKGFPVHKTGQISKAPVKKMSEKGKAIGKKVEANRNESFSYGQKFTTSAADYGKKLTAKERRQTETNIMLETMGRKTGTLTVAQKKYKQILLAEGYG